MKYYSKSKYVKYYSKIANFKFCSQHWKVYIIFCTRMFVLCLRSFEMVTRSFLYEVGWGALFGQKQIDLSDPYTTLWIFLALEEEKKAFVLNSM